MTIVIAVDGIVSLCGVAHFCGGAGPFLLLGVVDAYGHRVERMARSSQHFQWRSQTSKESRDEGERRNSTFISLGRVRVRRRYERQWRMFEKEHETSPQPTKVLDLIGGEFGAKGLY